MNKRLTLTSGGSETPKSRGAFIAFSADDVGLALAGATQVVAHGAEGAGGVAVARRHRRDRVGNRAYVLLTRLRQLGLDDTERVLPASVSEEVVEVEEEEEEEEEEEKDKEEEEE